MHLTHLLAFFSPLVLFGYWFIVGYAGLSLLYTQRTILRNMLTAPAIGLAITILGVFTFSWLGFPIKKFAFPFSLSLLFISIIILWYKKPRLSWKRYRLFFVLLPIALIITGRPLLEFGFEWLSYLNDDMLNYCLSANYFLEHGYFGPPDLSLVAKGNHYSSFYWFMHVPGLWRAGSELLIAWASALTSLAPEYIFMPVILALHLIVIHAIAALNYTSRKFWSLPFFSALLYTTSAMASLGIFYQLIAQADGLIFLITCATFLFKQSIPRYPNALLRYGILCTLLVSAFALFYPELFSFFILSALVYFSVLMVRKKFPVRLFFSLLGIISIGSLFFLHEYIFNFLTIILAQADHATQKITLQTALFPYFLIPSGIANLWGFQAIADLPTEPWLSLGIFLGATLLVVITIYAAKQLWQYKNACSAIAITGLALLIYFFIVNGDFILFKLAMYIQPFLWSMLAGFMIKHLKKKFLFYTILSGFILLNLYSEQIYLDRSRGVQWSDLPYAYKMNLKTSDTSAIFLSDSINMVLTKMESLKMPNNLLFFASRNFFKNIIDSAIYLNKSHKTSHDYRYDYLKKFQPDILSRYKEQFHQANINYHTACFKLFPGCNTFQQLDPTKQASTNTLLVSSIEQSILNRWNRQSFKDHLPVIEIPLKKIHNHLIFIDSKLGEHYYLPYNQSTISLYPMEKDYFYPDKTFSAIRHYFLFEILNPTQQWRIVLDMTTTLNADHKNRLPQAILIGEKRDSFPLVGYGSARVFSSIITPQTINHQTFFMLDMGKDGHYFQGAPRTGMMNLYGKIVLMDRRQLVGFGRDISAISESEYKTMQAPSIISQFPHDLNNPNLEYSGFYEDGWVGQDAYIYLQPNLSKTLLQIKGFVPTLSPLLTIWIDEKKIMTERLSPGNFDFNIPVELTHDNKRHCVKLHFSKMLKLAEPDNRPASVKIITLGFQ